MSVTRNFHGLPCGTSMGPLGTNCLLNLLCVLDASSDAADVTGARCSGGDGGGRVGRVSRAGCAGCAGCLSERCSWSMICL